MNRRLISIPLLSIKGSFHNDINHHKFIRGYVVAGMDAMCTWKNDRVAVSIFIPNEFGFEDKKTRILADEIAFNNQQVVIVPDIHYFHDVSYTSFLQSETASEYCKLTGNVEKDCEDLIEKYANSMTSKFGDTTMKFATYRAIVSAMQYSVREFSANKVISIVGVGSGAGDALTITAALNKFTLTNDYSFRDEFTEVSGFESTSKTGNMSNVCTLRNKSLTGYDGITNDEIEEDSVNAMISTSKPYITRALRVARGLQVDDVEDAFLKSESPIIQPPDVQQYQILLDHVIKDNIPQLHLHNYATCISFLNVLDVPQEEIRLINPCATLAICPTFYNVNDIIPKLSTPTHFVFGDKQLGYGSR
jgi:hypothetical protein